MKTVKHIHEVIFIIQRMDGQLTNEDLIQEIASEWGEDVGFVACSGNPFPKEEVLEFLLKRGKVELKDCKIHIHKEMSMCDGHKDF